MFALGGELCLTLYRRPPAPEHARGPGKHGRPDQKIKRDYHPVILQAAKPAHVFLEGVVITLQRR